jgi:hypothetical protein
VELGDLHGERRLRFGGKRSFWRGDFIEGHRDISRSF